MMLALIAALLLAPQENFPPPQADIEKAIKAGTEVLLKECRRDLAGGVVGVNSGMGYDYSALMLYTLVHSGLPLQDET
ncbi:MAG TPA: hypothetical protein VJU16_09570, partial [Planctomycetota bacterium]|nr:hypothetical protein [Planctomycetota bacterium]